VYICPQICCSRPENKHAFDFLVNDATVNDLAQGCGQRVPDDCTGV